MSKEELRQIRKNMGLTEIPPAPIENPIEQLCSEIRIEDRWRKIIVVTALVAATFFGVWVFWMQA